MSRNFALCLLILTKAPFFPAQTAPENLSRSYDRLQPQQQRLVNDWFRRLSGVVKKPVNPEEGYDKLPLSTQTTFNAVTHALLSTKLTDQSNRPLADSAIDIVEKLDGVAGEILGAGGDQQFRIYVQTNARVIDLLTRSKEFKRERDNTTYHKGYPGCFRSTKGTPSIQISLSRDATRADIDVDYRSSKFPIALVNGHLAASNSDVRVGNNDVRHNNQWNGLQNWWRNLFGLPLQDAAVAPIKVSDRLIAREPPSKGGKPSDAVHGFLNTWLVEQKPNEAIAYFSDEALACMETEGVELDRGMARFIMLDRMVTVNKNLGKISSLGSVTVGVPVTSERLKAIEQSHQDRFALYQVRDDLAEQFKCANRRDAAEMSPKAMKSRDFDKYVTALFKVNIREQPGRLVATLWHQQRDYWKLIAFVLDPEIDRSQVPNVGAAIPPSPPLDYVAGDRDMIKAASEFHKQWLVKKNIDEALTYLAPECLACAGLYRADDVPAPATPDEARLLLHRGMARAAATVGAVANLSAAASALDPHHPALKLVKHDDSKAFVVASIPDSMGDAARCDRRTRDQEPDFDGAQPPVYGKYFASGFSLGDAQANSGALWITWSKVDGKWKADSFVVTAP